MAKVLISVDDSLLARIDRAARSLNLSRSAYLARTAERDLADRQGERLIRHKEAIRRIQKIAAQHPEPDDGMTITEWIRRERDNR